MSDQEGASTVNSSVSDLGGVRRGALMEMVSDGVCRLDGAGRIIAINDVLVDELGYAHDKLLGEPFSAVVADADRTCVSEALSGRGRDSKEVFSNVTLETAGGEQLVRELRLNATNEADMREFVLVLRDGDNGGDAEREVVTDNPSSDSWQPFGSLVDAIDEYAIAMLDPTGRIVSWNGGAERVTGYSRDEILGEHIALLYAPRARNADDPEQLLDDAAAAGTVQYEGWCVQADGSKFWADTTVTAIRNDDGSLRGYAVVTRDATDRKHTEDDREEELERQREQLTALNNLNGVVRRINTALVQQSTREEIERLVCEQLSDSDSYEFAWVGEVDLHGKQIRVNTEAGVEGYLDDAEITIDGPAGRGPTGKAVRTGEMQVVQDMRTDSDYELWRELALDHGFQASAAIPISHDDTLYGVLNVYTGRSNAFDGEERDVIGQLGETVGHAIAAVERKRALMNDEMVEIEFRLRDVFGEFDVPVGDGTIRLEQAVPIGEGAYVEYGSATTEMVETLDSLPGNVPGWEEVKIIDRSLDETRFEARLSEPPINSAIASRGCRVKESVIRNGDHYLLVQLPQGAAVRQLVESVKEEASSVELVSQRQVREQLESRQQYRQTVLGNLTDRQRTVLESAYFSGFFEWPRETTGEELADTLDIAASTFHQHLRKSERQIMAALLDETAVTE